MHQYKIKSVIILILPIINFAFALPMAVQETRQLCRNVVPDIAITMLVKRGDETETQSDVYSELLSGKPSSPAAHPPSGSAQSGSEQNVGPMSSTTHDHDSNDPSQTDASEIEEASPELTKFPSLSDYFLESSGSSSSLDHLASPDSFASAGDYLASPDRVSDAWSTTGSPKKEPMSESFLSKLFSKIKLWRRISGPGPVGDGVNTVQGEFQGLVDTGVYVSVSNPDSQRSNFYDFSTMVRDIRKSLNVPPTPATGDVCHPATDKLA